MRVPIASREGMVLKPEYQELADSFDPGGGCSCHISPPCGFCTHPGNPSNLEDNDDAWEYEHPNIDDQSKLRTENVMPELQSKFQLGDLVVRKSSARAWASGEGGFNTVSVEFIGFSEGGREQYRLRSSSQIFSPDQLVLASEAKDYALEYLCGRISEIAKFRYEEEQF